mmetsp:Transcript_14652/g.43380  ORF Transcript_14652/g.43380 Transcript_14652/m.43380 type:complete len:1064 (+) Transcript_14652:23-3214(+)
MRLKRPKQRRETFKGTRSPDAPAVALPHIDDAGRVIGRMHSTLLDNDGASTAADTDNQDQPPSAATSTAVTTGAAAPSRPPKSPRLHFRRKDRGKDNAKKQHGTGRRVKGATAADGTSASSNPTDLNAVKHRATMTVVRPVTSAELLPSPPPLDADAPSTEGGRDGETRTTGRTDPPVFTETVTLPEALLQSGVGLEVDVSADLPQEEEADTPRARRGTQRVATRSSPSTVRHRNTITLSAPAFDPAEAPTPTQSPLQSTSTINPDTVTLSGPPHGEALESQSSPPRRRRVQARSSGIELPRIKSAATRTAGSKVPRKGREGWAGRGDTPGQPTRRGSDHKWYQVEPETAAEPCGFDRSCSIKRKHLHCVVEGCGFVLDSLDFKAFNRHVKTVHMAAKEATTLSAHTANQSADEPKKTRETALIMSKKKRYVLRKKKKKLTTGSEVGGKSVHAAHKPTARGGGVNHTESTSEAPARGGGRKSAVSAPPPRGRKLLPHRGATRAKSARAAVKRDTTRLPAVKPASRGAPPSRRTAQQDGDPNDVFGGGTPRVRRSDPAAAVAQEPLSDAGDDHVDTMHDENTTTTEHAMQEQRDHTQETRAEDQNGRSDGLTAGAGRSHLKKSRQQHHHHHHHHLRRKERSLPPVIQPSRETGCVQLHVSGATWDTHWDTLLAEPAPPLQQLLLDSLETRWAGGDGEDGPAVSLETVLPEHDFKAFGAILARLEDQGDEHPFGAQDAAVATELVWLGLTAVVPEPSPIYVVGGWQRVTARGLRRAGVCGSILRYDPRSSSWATVGTDLNPPRQHHGGTALFGEMFVCGGQTDDTGNCVTPRVDCFDGDTKTWRPQRRLPPRLTAPAHSVRVETFGYSVYVVGGIGNSGRFNGRLWRYDVRDRRRDAEWEKLPSMPRPRSGFGTAVLFDSLYVVGGWDGHDQLSSVLCFNLQTHKWISVQPMLQPRYAFGCAALRKHLYAIGGGVRGARGVEATTHVERYDPEGNFWERLPSMRHPRMAAACIAANAKLYVLGGQDTKKATLRSVEVYDPDTNSWSSAPDMPEGRTAASACVLPK